MNETPSTSLTTQEVANKYNVHLTTVARWLASGRLPHLKIGKSVRITPANLAQFEKSHTVKGIS